MIRKNFPSISCIYMIVSKTNGYRYIGATSNLKMRMYNHFKEFEFNANHIKKLQEHVIKYGIEDLKVLILEECPASFLKVREKFYIWDKNPELNIWKNGYHLSDAQKLQISNFHEGRKLSNEIREKMKEGQKSEKLGVPHKIKQV